MTFKLFQRLAVPLLLISMIVLWVPDAGANTVKDDDLREWTCSAVRNGGYFHVRVQYAQGAEPAQTFWATDGSDGSRDNIDPFLFTDGTRVWLAWSRETGATTDTYEIYLREIDTSGPLYTTTKQVTKPDDSNISDRQPSAARCPYGFHVAFRRDLNVDGSLVKRINYVTDIWTEGNWISADVYEFELSENQDATSPTMLVSPTEDGYPLMLTFQHWVTHHSLGGGGSKRSIAIDIYQRELDSSDPNPWEKVQMRIPTRD